MQPKHDLIQPVIRGVRFFLAHVPGLVEHGSKPARDLEDHPDLIEAFRSHLRSFEDAVCYPPNRAFLGDIDPDTLKVLPKPWFQNQTRGNISRWQKHGEIMPEEAFLGILKWCDHFNLVWLERQFTQKVREVLMDHPYLAKEEIEQIDSDRSSSAIAESIQAGALPLRLRSGEVVGCIHADHDRDDTLKANVLLENLTCKATAVMALRTLLKEIEADPNGIHYLLNCGEEAIGDRYQRGGGNLAKAAAEMNGCVNATGSDIKAFCCAPLHALVVAAGLVSSGLYRRVAVVAGGSLAKLGMKLQGHLDNDQPILEDVLAGFALLVGEDDGHSPIIRMDSVGSHPVKAGGSQQEIYQALVVDPIKRLGLTFSAIDKYATELHNPEVTEPAGSGDVPALNYRTIAALAVREQEIERDELQAFADAHGMPGYSPTQGHIASAVPYLGHTVDRILEGKIQRVMLLGKGSLFLGRMTQMSDGLSLIVEKNPGS